ncbi:hypothetical protein ONZ45_g1655 [Pleurotus djamor]|nr:hypothetical protein ONZ45_g1655 [Pleurotus djamor]
MPHTAKKGMKKGKSRSRLPQALVPFANDFDAKIAASFVQMRHWCEERNRACSATRNVPAEILSMIFGHLLDGAMKWLAVTYVCRQWRMAALSDPSLWCDLTHVKGKWLDRFLTLAKASPLSVHCVADGRSLDAVTEALIDLPERLGKLYITDCTDEILERLNKATPFLTRLTLDAFSWGEEAYTITDGFLGGSAPRLRSFCLTSGAIPSNPSWLANVEDLALRGSWAIEPATGGPARLTTRSLLDLIKPLEALTELKVDLNRLRDRPLSPYAGPKVCFPRLRSLGIGLGNDTSRSIGLLHHIETPLLDSLSVKWSYDSDVNTDNLQDNSLDAIKMIYKFFAKTTRSSPSKIEWKAGDIDSDVILSSSHPPRTLTLANVPLEFNYNTIPFSNLESIKTVAIASPEFLVILDSVSGVLDPWPYLERVEVTASALIPKHRGLPALKRWLKSRLGVRKLKIVGVESLSDRDIQPLHKIVNVKWLKGGS